MFFACINWYHFPINYFNESRWKYVQVWVFLARIFYFWNEWKFNYAIKTFTNKFKTFPGNLDRNLPVLQFPFSNDTINFLNTPAKINKYSLFPVILYECSVPASFLLFVICTELFVGFSHLHKGTEIFRLSWLASYLIFSLRFVVKFSTNITKCIIIWYNKGRKNVPALRSEFSSLNATPFRKGMNY